ncbi:MAG: hypothetical protein WCD40_04610, partial [Candidatus Acidiferrales bacterium]
ANHEAQEQKRDIGELSQLGKHHPSHSGRPSFSRRAGVALDKGAREWHARKRIRIYFVISVLSKSWRAPAGPIARGKLFATKAFIVR